MYRNTARLLLVLCALLALSGCAGLSTRDPVRVNLVGLEPLQGEGFELRFALKLRVQNPNDHPIDYDGLALQLDVNDRTFATGVSDARGSVPRFGEAVVSVPVTVSALSAFRQALELGSRADLDRLPYTLSGKLGGGPFGVQRFSERGTLSLPAATGGTQ
ncbi:MAG: LEA type 2 family protein [Methyloversatilis discipulorum]|jgi:LEA14-like dessication related protein|uniref:LEA type 2 family protein n=1 Tax=Methyloversatilis discipulorum TaxID=1119528 RepID=UPI0026F154D6|nr:LEA type 2 family protein [Methyloversatilis discipulorum]MBV5285829.1 LEA type 2 family protein [Methyloversatilis discipulorum]